MRPSLPHLMTDIHDNIPLTNYTRKGGSRIEERLSSEPWLSRTILCLLLFMTHSKVGLASSAEELLCNANTDYACICQEGRGNLAATLPSCQHFIQILQAADLPVVDMRVRHVNMQSKLHTGERYERYFKRRIAAIVSAYCERELNECWKTQLRLTPTSADDDVLYGVEEGDPLLSQENVLLLHVDAEPLNVTRLRFAVVRNLRGGALIEEDLIDPVKIKYILGSQRAPLARVLGGIKIDSVRVSRVPRAAVDTISNPTDKRDAGSNKKLIIGCAVVGGFFLICYIIGGIKLYRDCQKRKRKKITEQAEILRATNKTPTYGACDIEKGRSNIENGEQPWQKSPSQHRQHVSYGCIDEPASFICNTSPTRSSVSPLTDLRPRVLTQREAQLMFTCDPSQLPKELSMDDSMFDLFSSSEPSSRPLHSAKPGKEMQKKASIDSISEPRTQAVVEMNKNRPRNEVEVPAVLITANSRDSAMSSPGEDVQSSAPSDVDTEATIQEATASSPPAVHRPKSRRGSRVDDSGENIDLTELLPDAIMAASAKKAVVHTTDDAWSSSEGEVDVYYKLSEDEEIVRGDDWPKQQQPNGQIGHSQSIPLRSKRAARGTRQICLTGNVNDSEDDDGEDLHFYERLREESSPNPPLMALDEPPISSMLEESDSQAIENDEDSLR